MVRSSSRPRSRSRSPRRSSPRQTPSSSVDSSDDPPPLLNNSSSNGDHEEAKSTYLDTDLSSERLGDVKKEKRHDWIPIKPLTRSTNAGSFFVKVFMEGVMIGRKIDILAHNNYDDLIASLARMFNSKIHCPGESATTDYPDKRRVLTYEDKDGDWMMVRDVPWEMFECTVKRMMITRADKC